ncbi:UPF0149 family protein [Agaribacter flavus]|uniref:UPF0149 family protein n=1 Tax=Agaribacter flavus TaxID=1902781 RepID=A0ABV7FSL1_9ALTE
MKTLSPLYDSIADSSFLHDRHFVEGAILGACSCPEIPLPDDWLPWVVQEHNQIQNKEQADRVFSKLFDYFRYILSEMRNDEFASTLPLHYSQASLNAELQAFMQGLIYAHQQCEKVWHMAWQKMREQNPDDAPVLAKDLKHCLLMFSSFADLEQAGVQAAERGEHSLSDKLPLIAQSLPKAMEKYLNISGKLASYLPNQFETFSAD